MALEERMNMITLKVSGMTCGACVRHVSGALQPLAGVESVDVDLATGIVRVQGNADSAPLIAALDEAGYPAEIAGETAAPAAAKTGCGGSGGCGCR